MRQEETGWVETRCEDGRKQCIWSAQTWAEGNVAEFALGLGSLTRSSSVLGWSAHPSAGAMTPPTGERAEAPRRPLFPHTVHCQQRTRVKTHTHRSRHAHTHTHTHPHTASFKCSSETPPAPTQRACLSTAVTQPQWIKTTASFPLFLTIYLSQSHTTLPPSRAPQLMTFFCLSVMKDVPGGVLQPRWIRLGSLSVLIKVPGVRSARALTGLNPVISVKTAGTVSPPNVKSPSLMLLLYNENSNPTQRALIKNKLSLKHSWKAVPCKNQLNDFAINRKLFYLLLDSHLQGDKIWCHQTYAILVT